MIRDFTELTKEQIQNSFDIIQSDLPWDSQDGYDLRTLKIYEYLIDSSYITDGIDELVQHYQDLYYQNGYTNQFVDRIFEGVRQDDVDYSIKHIERRSESLDLYKKALSDILDVIRITDENNPSISEIQIGDFGSIFSERESFARKFENVGDGMVEPAFKNLFTTDGEIDYNKVRELMENGATGWELVALSRLLDTYRIDKNGKINSDGLENFLEQCYLEQTDFIWGYKTYDISLTFKELSLYRAGCTEMSLLNYSTCFGEQGYEEETNILTYDCYISDLSMMLCNYYGEGIEVNNNRTENIIELDFSDNLSELKVKIRNQHKNKGKCKNKDISIEAFSKDLNQSNLVSNYNSYEDEKKDSDLEVILAGSSLMKKIAFSQLDSQCRNQINMVLPEGKEVFNGINKINNYTDISYNESDWEKYGLECLFGLDDVRKGVENQNAMLDEQKIHAEKLYYLNAAGSYGSTCQYGNQIILSNVVVNKQELNLRLEYYKEIENIQISLDEYMNYINDISSSENILNDSDISQYADFVKKVGITTGQNEGYNQWRQEHKYD